MKFFIPLIASLSLAATVLALPALASDCRSVSCRHAVAQRDLALESLIEDLVVRGKKSSGSNKATVAAAVSKVQQGQTNRAQKKQEKAAINKKTVEKASNSPLVKEAAAPYREKAKAAGKPMKEINAKSDKIKAAAKSRAVTNAVKDAKAGRKDKLAAQAKTPEQKAASKAAQADRRKERKAAGIAPGPRTQPKTPKPAGLDKQQKHNVKQQFASAAQKLKDTKGLPGRKDQVKVGDSTTDGRAARQGAFNTYLHSKNPVGRNPINKQPKAFNNRPYPADHKDAALAGKKALPQNGKEYPVINNSPNGFTASNTKPGPLRTVTYKKGGERHAAVIGHDKKKDPKHEDEHYVATPVEKKSKK